MKLNNMHVHLLPVFETTQKDQILDVHCVIALPMHVNIVKLLQY